MPAKLPRFICFAGFTGFMLALPALAQPPAAPTPIADEPAVPRGVDVQARGPIHEAFATPTAEPQATTPVAKKPPAPIDEMPPEEKPEGEVTWISGYWAFDDERADFLWISGCWRTLPPGRQWVPGYWREQGNDWQWVPGFWAAAEAKAADTTVAKAPEVTYYPEPPAPPQVAPPGPAPNADSFFVPGQWVWREGRYVWVGGYWARVQPDYVWVPSHYRWTPYGYVYVPGYWDHTLAHRGILYAPVVVDHTVVGPTFVYTPAYAVTDVVIVDSFWVRPCRCHYYFGDYYGPVYRRYGYESVVVYSDRHYDSIIVYRTWEYRNDPRWRERQVTIYVEREHGRAPLPPRTLVEQRLAAHQHAGPVLAPATRVAAAQGIKTVTVTTETRVQVKTAARTAQAVTVEQRVQVETKAAGPVTGPRTAAITPATAHAHVAAGAAVQQGLAGQAAPKGGPVIPAKGTVTAQPGTVQRPPVQPAVHAPPQPPPHQGPPPKQQQNDGKKKNDKEHPPQ
jgi:hypothetical protein